MKIKNETINKDKIKNIYNIRIFLVNREEYQIN